MKEKKIKYRSLLNIELEFNSMKYKGLELGNLLSYYLGQLYNEKISGSIFYKIGLLIYFLIKSISKKEIMKEQNKRIIYYASGNHRHLVNLQSTLSDCPKINENTLYISASDKIFRLFTLKEYFQSFFFILLKMCLINRKLKSINLPFKMRLSLIIYLQLQLLKATSLMKFVINQKNTVLIGADYDRGIDSSLLFAVAKALRIHSFTFQHGVLNPPVGYSPINADEIWVWGEMAKKQLIALGVHANKIRITGTPIVQDIRLSTEEREKIQKKLALGPGLNIVLALSEPNRTNDEILVGFLSEIKKAHSVPEDNFFVKIHPSRNFEDFKWIKEKYNINLLPHDIPYHEFMNIVDIVLAHTSGITAEALYYNKKVGIMDVINQPLGNGLELNKYFNIPILKTVEDFMVLYSDKLPMISNELFYKVGEKAKKEIQNNILSFL